MHIMTLKVWESKSNDSKATNQPYEGMIKNIRYFPHIHFEPSPPPPTTIHFNKQLSGELEIIRIHDWVRISDFLGNFCF